uniref:LamG-like jellyroll fold domain-containing protein n=1 Tax=Chromera velia CCMP2878 TaxID=1169474 RepID=A0A0G4I404_9ALVE|eukprot:Cvel_1789.t1-p1 / transcript=Cvel_1789.t1 / gene=Cvel_1789 / organism=Chromera_velia_CCMP2878 / gene_product=hypothetical protein / transcript_product=hypothetical protein / location=Cvel_scaffold65:143766-150223(+) / protein_length=653 / sequence_SO=supercontig / SO=protein_coding / is_pseudo=false
MCRQITGPKSILFSLYGCTLRFDDNTSLLQLPVGLQPAVIETTLDRSRWTHVVLVFSGTGRGGEGSCVSLYVDGKKLQADTEDSAEPEVIVPPLASDESGAEEAVFFHTASLLPISDSSSEFCGLLSLISMWKKSFSAEEVEVLNREGSCVSLYVDGKKLQADTEDSAEPEVIVPPLASDESGAEEAVFFHTASLLPISDSSSEFCGLLSLISMWKKSFSAEEVEVLNRAETLKDCFSLTLLKDSLVLLSLGDVRNAAQSTPHILNRRLQCQTNPHCKTIPSTVGPSWKVSVRRANPDSKVPPQPDKLAFLTLMELQKPNKETEDQRSSVVVAALKRPLIQERIWNSLKQPLCFDFITASHNRPKGGIWNLAAGTGGSCFIGVGECLDSSFTAAAWVKPRPTGEGLMRFLSKPREPSGTGWCMYAFTSSEVRPGAVGVAGMATEHPEFWGVEELIDIDRWVHVAASADWRPGGRVVLYVNGKEVKSETIRENVSRTRRIKSGPDEPLIIGREFQSTNLEGGRKFDGQVFDVRVFRTALSAHAVAHMAGVNDHEGKEEVMEAEREKKCVGRWLGPAEGRESHANRLPTKTGRAYMYKWPQGRRRKEIEKAVEEERLIDAYWEKEKIKVLNSKRFAGKCTQEEVKEEEEGWGKAD